jgi:hypothetical protein
MTSGEPFLLRLSLCGLFRANSSHTLRPHDQTATAIGDCSTPAAQVLLIFRAHSQPTMKNSILACRLFAASSVLGASLASWNFGDVSQEEEKKVESVLGRVFVHQKDEIPVEYGADISFPMQHDKVSTNYPWLPHNVDPTIPTPPEYANMPINPLGNRQAAYDDFIQGCVKHFGSRGQRCIETEKDRFDMTLRQPQSMQVSYRISFGHFFDFKCT